MMKLPNHTHGHPELVEGFSHTPISVSSLLLAICRRKQSIKNKKIISSFTFLIDE